MYRNENLYDDIIRAAGKKYNVPVALIKATIGKESSFNPKAWARDMKADKIIAVSYGLMQLTWKTAVSLGFPNDTKRYMELMDPAVNIPLGVKYLSILMQRYGFKDPKDIYASYNGGPDEPGKKNPDGTFQNRNVQEHVDQFMPIYNYFFKKESGTLPVQPDPSRPPLPR